ncbi:MAG: hypothetical protein NW218_18280 [Saprospiraceae bacterium]|nr:hypothetical protein [Saprospiraceae bacterium]
MTNYFAKLGFEVFMNKVADTVIERGADKIAESVVEKIKPMLSQNTNAAPKPIPDQILTRKGIATILRISEPTLRKMYREGDIKVYGTGAGRMRFKSTEVIT